MEAASPLRKAGIILFTVPIESVPKSLGLPKNLS